jgi:hypothetical protein
MSIATLRPGENPAQRRIRLRLEGARYELNRAAIEARDQGMPALGDLLDNLLHELGDLLDQLQHR